MQDIHDIKGLVLSAGYTTWVWWLLGVILVVILTAVVTYYLKKRSNQTARSPKEQLPPDVKALRQLDAMDVATVGGKDFYFRLSAVLRVYIFDKFGLGAPEMTTEEFVPRLGHLPLDMETRKKLIDLCWSGDTIKFAKGIAVEKQMQDDLDYVKVFVRRTAMAGKK